jgi:hypothetical protein
MSIIRRYINPSNKVKDYRNTHRVFYVAFCEQCGRKYYPNRCTSKFCSKFCSNSSYLGNINHDKERNLIEAGYYETREINDSIKSTKPQINESKLNKITFVGALAVYKYFSQYYNTTGQKGKILKELKSLEIEENYGFGFKDSNNTVSVKKISPLVYMLL